MSTHEEALSGRDFARLSAFVYSEAGICLGPEKKTMLEGRLKRRLARAEHRLLQAVLRVPVRAGGLREEKVSFIDVVTTNKTDFFREAKHFDYLTERALPELVSSAGGRPLLVWSAGCSSGKSRTRWRWC